MRARLPREAADAQKNHPVAWWSLLLAAIAVMAVGVTLLGILMKRLWPSPTALQVVAGAGVCILPMPLFLLVGAAGWLLVARRIVPRAVAKAFFVHSGFGMLSRVSEGMVVRAYGQERGYAVAVRTPRLPAAPLLACHAP